jgi:opacity protein-like surface antigen
MTKMTSALCAGLLFLSGTALASTSWSVDSFKDLIFSNKNLEFSAAVGPNWAHTPSTYLVVSPFETDSVLKNNISNSATWKLGVGYHFFADQLQQRSFFNDFLVELNFYQSWATINGNVWQYQLPQFNNFTFKAPLTSYRLMLDVKPGLFTVSRISLYPILGIGNSWNDIAYNETVTGTGVPAGSNYLLGRSTNTNFAYDLGVGLRADITEHISASLEYLYSNLGNISPSSTSKNSNAIISAPTFDVYNQSLLLGISWKI